MLVKLIPLEGTQTSCPVLPESSPGLLSLPPPLSSLYETQCLKETEAKSYLYDLTSDYMTGRLRVCGLRCEMNLGSYKIIFDL